MLIGFSSTFPCVPFLEDNYTCIEEVVSDSSFGDFLFLAISHFSHRTLRDWIMQFSARDLLLSHCYCDDNAHLAFMSSCILQFSHSHTKFTRPLGKTTYAYSSDLDFFSSSAPLRSPLVSFRHVFQKTEVSSSSHLAPSPRLSSLHKLPHMDKIDDCIAKGDITVLITLCEELELTAAVRVPFSSRSSQGRGGASSSATQGSSSSDTLDPTVYAILQAAHLIQNDFPAARYVVKRTPRAAAETEEFKAVTTVATHLWNRDFPSAYSAMQSAQWSPPLLSLIERLRVSVQERIMKLLGASYESISLVDVAALLGLGSPAEVVDLAAKSGWEVDTDGGWLIPQTTKGARNAADGPALDELESLTKLVLHLEGL